MILKTTTNEFCFINVSFYETIADPRHFFEQDYEEMPEYEEESDFDFDSYYNKFIPFVQEWANEVSERLYGYGVNSIKVTSVGYPKEYNYGTDWMNVEVEFCDEWRQKMLSNISKIVNDDKCKKYAETNYRSVSGYIFLGPEDLKEFEKEIIERKSDSGYDVTILLNMYLTLAFVKEFGFKAGEAWSEITEYATDVYRIPILQQQRCLYRKVRSIYSKTFTRQRPTNYIIMSWINSDGRGVIRNISQKQNYARC